MCNYLDDVNVIFLQQNLAFCLQLSDHLEQVVSLFEVHSLVLGVGEVLDHVLPELGQGELLAFILLLPEGPTVFVDDLVNESLLFVEAPLGLLRFHQAAHLRLFFQFLSLFLFGLFLLFAHALLRSSQFHHLALSPQVQVLGLVLEEVLVHLLEPSVVGLQEDLKGLHAVLHFYELRESQLRIGSGESDYALQRPDCEGHYSNDFLLLCLHISDERPLLADVVGGFFSQERRLALLYVLEVLLHEVHTQVLLVSFLTEEDIEVVEGSFISQGTGLLVILFNHSSRHLMGHSLVVVFREPVIPRHSFRYLSVPVLVVIIHHDENQVKSGEKSVF